VYQKAFLYGLTASLISTASLFTLEFSKSGGFPYGIPWAVFFFLGFTSFIAVSSITFFYPFFSVNRSIGISVLAIGVLFLASWTYLFLDQLPCFLGGSGC
jgi:multidrug transporter EmrE-like cation transporter